MLTRDCRVFGQIHRYFVLGLCAFRDYIIAIHVQSLERAAYDLITRDLQEMLSEKIMVKGNRYTE